MRRSDQEAHQTLPSDLHMRTYSRTPGTHYLTIIDLTSFNPPCTANSVCNWTQVLTHERRKQNNMKGLWNDTAGWPTLSSALLGQTHASRHADWTFLCGWLHFLIPTHQSRSTSMLPRELLPGWWQIWEGLWVRLQEGPPTFEFSTWITTGLTNTTFPCHVDRSENLALVVKFSLMPGS